MIRLVSTDKALRALRGLKSSAILGFLNSATETHPDASQTALLCLRRCPAAAAAAAPLGRCPRRPVWPPRLRESGEMGWRAGLRRERQLEIRSCL